MDERRLTVSFPNEKPFESTLEKTFDDLKQLHKQLEKLKKSKEVSKLPSFPSSHTFSGDKFAPVCTKSTGPIFLLFLFCRYDEGEQFGATPRRVGKVLGRAAHHPQRLHVRQLPPGAQTESWSALSPD